MRKLRIILVHGTWGRSVIPFLGFFKSQVAPWCKPDSKFIQRLTVHCNRSGISPEFEIFNWSGDNSFEERHLASVELSDLVSSNDQECLLIGHSHGGNVALKAISKLRNRDINNSTKICTIATPFIDVNFIGLSGSRRRLVVLFQFSAIIASLTLMFTIGIDYFVGESFCALVLFVLFLGSMPYLFNFVAKCIFGYHFEIVDSSGRLRNDFRLVANRSKMKVVELAQIKNNSHFNRLLVLRGIDDEASLILSMASFYSRLLDFLLTILRPVEILIAILMSILSLLAIIPSYILNFIFGDFIRYVDGESIFVFAIFSVFLMASFFAFIILCLIFRSLFGSELLFGGLPLSVAANSTPDGNCDFKVVTLPGRGSGAFRLNHGLYDHTFCAFEIVKWLKYLKYSASHAGKC